MMLDWKQIRNNLISFNVSDKIIQYILTELASALEENGEWNLQSMLSQTLQWMLQCQWQIFLKAYPCKSDLVGIDPILEKMLLNLTVLHACQQQQHPMYFENIVDIKTIEWPRIYKFLSTYFAQDRLKQRKTANKYLKTLILILPLLSSQEILQNGILSCLTNLIGNQEHSDLILKNVLGIFKFFDSQASSFQVLQQIQYIFCKYLQIFTGSDKDDTKIASHIILLTNQLLPKYCSLIAKIRSLEQYRELSEEESHKLRIFKQTYWKLVSFGNQIMMQVETIQQSLSVNLIFHQQYKKTNGIFFVSTLVGLHQQLNFDEKEGSQEQINLNNLVLCGIIEFATLHNDFYTFYSEKGLIQNMHFQPQIEQQYKKFVYVILIDQKTHLFFINLVEREMFQQMIQPKQRDRTPSQILRVRNFINRTSWTIFLATYNPQLRIDMDIFSLCQKMVQYAEMDEDLEDCLLMNSKYILQTQLPCNNSIPVIMEALKVSEGFQMKFNMTLLSNILMINRAVDIEFKDLKYIVSRLEILEFEHLNNGKDETLSPYVSILKILIEKIGDPLNQLQVKQIFDDMLSIESIGRILKREISTSSQSQLIRLVNTCRKMKQIYNFFMKILDSTNPPQHVIDFINSAGKKITNRIISFAHRYTQSRDLLKLQQNTFRLQRLIQFRRQYLLFQSSWLQVAKYYKYYEIDQSPYLELIRLDFQNNAKFRNLQYLSLELSAYKCFKVIDPIDWWVKDMNNWITQIVTLLQRQGAISDINNNKYEYWKEILKISGLQLNNQNQTLLLRLYDELNQKKIARKQIKSIMEVYHTLMHVISHQFTFLQMDIFLFKTFASLFSSPAETIPIFHSISTLLSSLIQFCTIDVALRWVEEYIPIQLKNNQEHHERLVLAFQNRDLSHRALKQYVLFTKKSKLFPRNLP